MGTDGAGGPFRRWSTGWRKSRRSGTSGGDCVEVAGCAAGVAVRDSTDAAGPRLVFSTAAWHRFIGQVRGGDHDP